MEVCEHNVPLGNICDTCELGPMPMKKPTLEQVAWIFEQINENAGGSFRKLIYDRLGFGPNAYSELYAAGGQNITNAMCAENHSVESKIDLIDSQIEQIEVLRPVYEAAKILIPAQEYGNRKAINNATHAFVRAVNLAARELEDTNE